MRLAYSTNDGQIWSAPFTPHHDDQSRERGFAALFSMAGSRPDVVWLDGHATASAGHGSAGAAEGAMGLRFAAFDAAWRQTSETAIDDRVSDCCPTTAAMTSEGTVVA